MSGNAYRWQDDLPLDGTEFAARLTPGMTVDAGSVTDFGDPKQVIDVAYVEELGDGMVHIHDVSGWHTTTCADMCLTIITPELADLIGFVVLAEQDRHLGAGHG